MSKPEVRSRNGQSWEDAVQTPVVVEKTVETREDGFVIEYDVRSMVDERVGFSIVDRIGLPEFEEVGFHADHEPNEWTREEQRITLEHVLDPAEERCFVLGIVTGHRPEGTEALEGPPTVQDFENAEPDSEGGLYARAKRSLVPGEAGEPSDDEPNEGERGTETEWESPPQPEPAESNREEIDWELPPRSEPDESNEDVSAMEAESDTPTPSEPEASTGEEPDLEAEREPPKQPKLGEAENLAARIAEELDRGIVDEETQAILAEHLGTGGSRSVDLRLERAQARIEDLSTYVEVFERFVDSHGTFEEYATATGDRLEALEERLDQLEDRSETATDDLDSRIDTLGEQVESLDSDLSRISQAQTTTDETVTDLEERLSRHLSEVEASIDRFERLQQAITEAVEEPRSAASGP